MSPLPLLELSSVTVTRGGRDLLHEVSLRVLPGQFLALLGPNGAGKTTLLKAALGLTQVSRGGVRLAGSELRAMTPRQRAAHVAYLPQQAAIHEALDTREVVATARYRFGESQRIALEYAERALHEIGAGDLCGRAITQLSGGERQRVLFAALLAQDTPLLLLDEPANHLDPAQQIEVYRMLDVLWERGKAIVCVTHDVNLLRHLSRPEQVRVAGLRSGRLDFEATYAAPDLALLLEQLFGITMREVRDENARLLIAQRGQR